MRRVGFMVFVASAVVAFAGSPNSKLLGTWLWRGVDAEAVLTFRPDHTCMRERNGFDYYDSTEATWQIDDRRLTIAWPDTPKIVYTIVELSSDRLVLRSEPTCKETWTRLK
jgi:hypothetical protein